MRPLHAALKVAQGSSALTRGLQILTIALLLGACFYGLWLGCAKLHQLWIDQCVVTDAKAQVTVSATPHITEEHVREWFGLTNGCNLARIDFRDVRDRVLREHPIVHDITVTRHLPNRVDISLGERKPIARVNMRRRKVKQGAKEVELTNWDVADAEGVVFEFAKRDTQALPVITEKIPTARRGERLSGRALSALRLIELGTVRGLLAVPFPEVSTANETYLTATTRNYSTVKIDWSLVDNPNDPDQPTLARILGNFQKECNKGLFPDRCVFTITEPDRMAVLPNE